MAGARQRLRDRRGRGAPVRADAGADRARSARRTPASAPTESCCCREPDEPGLRGAAADLQPRRLRGRAVGQRRARGDPVPAPPRLDRQADAFSIQTAAGEIRPTITGPTTECTVDMGRRATAAPTTTRRRRRRRPRRADRGRARLALSARLRSATRSARSRSTDERRWRRSTCRRSARRSSATSCSRTARTCRGSPARDPTAIRARIFERGVGETSASGTGATGAAVAHVLARRTLAGDRGARRRRARGRGGGGPAHQPDRLGGARVPRARWPTSSSRSCMRPSKRLERIPPYLFAELERKIAAKRAAGRRRDQPRHRRSRHADVRRRSSTAAQRGGRRPEHAPVPVATAAAPEFREAVARLLRAPLRRDARPRDRGDAGDRRQGVHLQPQPRVPRPRRRRAGRPIPATRSTPAARCSAGAEPVLMPLVPELRLRARPRRDRRRRRCAGAADVPQLPEQPDRRGRARTGCSSGSSSSPRDHDILVVHDNAYSETTYDGYVAPSFLADARAPRRSASRCSRCPRATT